MLPTGSRWPRFARCPGSAVLPQVETQAGEAAERGSALHRYRLRAAQVGVEGALLEVPAEWRDDAEEMPLDLDLLARSAQELSLVYSIVGGHATEASRGADGRHYGPLAPSEVAMTLDLVAVSADRTRALVEDLKTGRSAQPPARDHWQLRMGALAVGAIYPGVETIELRITHAPGDGVCWTDRYEADRIDLGAWAEEARAVVEDYRAAERAVASGRAPDVSEGEWCRYCPAYTSCPAKTALVRAAAFGEMVEPPLAAIVPADFPAAYATWRRMKEATDRVGSALHAIAREWGEAPIGEGQVLREVETTRESLDGPTVAAVLAARFGAEVASVATKLTATKGDLKEALRAIAEKGQLAGMEREVLGVLRERGAIAVSRSSAMREVKA